MNFYIIFCWTDKSTKRKPWYIFQALKEKMIIMVTGHWPHNFCLISRGLVFFSSTQSFYYYITTFTKTCHSVEYTVNSIHWLITIQHSKVKRQSCIILHHKYNLRRIICVTDAEIRWNIRAHNLFHKCSSLQKVLCKGI